MACDTGTVFRYPDGAVKTAKIDLRERVLQEFGADVPDDEPTEE